MAFKKLMTLCFCMTLCSKNPIDDVSKNDIIGQWALVCEHIIYEQGDTVSACYDTYLWFFNFKEDSAFSYSKERIGHGDFFWYCTSIGRFRYSIASNQFYLNSNRCGYIDVKEDTLLFTKYEKKGLAKPIYSRFAFYRYEDILPPIGWPSCTSEFENVPAFLCE